MKVYYYTLEGTRHCLKAPSYLSKNQQWAWASESLRLLRKINLKALIVL